MIHSSDEDNEEEYLEDEKSKTEDKSKEEEEVQDETKEERSTKSRAIVDEKETKRKSHYTEEEFRKVISKGLSNIKYEEETWNKLKRKDYSAVRPNKKHRKANSQSKFAQKNNQRKC